MAFPTVSGITTYSDGGTATASWNMLSGESVTVGELLVAVVATQTLGTISTSSTGWTIVEQGSAAASRPVLSILTKVATGSSENLTLTNSAGISNWSGILYRTDGNAAYVSTVVGSSTGAVNPPSIDPGAVRDHLYIAAGAARNVTFTAAPTNYGNLTQIGSGAGGINGRAVTADRQLNGQVEDPGAFAGTARWAAATIAIEPTTGGGGPTTYNDTRSETASAGESSTTTATFPSTRSETATVGDTVVGGVLYSVTLSESATAAGAFASGTTWDPANKAANIALSGGNLIANTTDDGSFTWDMVLGTTSKTTGTRSFTATYGADGPYGSNALAGFVGSTFIANGYTLANYGPGLVQPSIGIDDTGDVARNGAIIASLGAFTTVECKIDLATGDVSFKRDGGSWEGPYTTDLTGGMAVYPAAGGFNAKSVTADFTNWDTALPSTYSETLTETAATAATQAGAATYPNTLAEAATAGDSEAATPTFRSSLTETCTAGESETSAATFAPPLSETGSVGESTTTTATFGSALTETGTAGDSGTGGSIFGSSVSEPGTAAESLAAAATWPNTRSESAAANDNQTSAVTFASPLTETATGATTFTGNVIGGAQIYDDALTETVTAAESFTASAVFASSASESVTASHSATTAQTFGNALSEALAGSDGLSAALTIAKALSEAATAAASQAGQRTIAFDLAETVVANDNESAVALWGVGYPEAFGAEALAAAAGGISTFTGGTLSHAAGSRTVSGAAHGRSVGGAAKLRRAVSQPRRR